MGRLAPTPVEDEALPAPTASPALLADERLAEIIAGPADIETLARALDDCRAAGVRENMPNFKKATALLATLEASANNATSEADAKPRAMDGSVDMQLDMLFGGGYAIPDELD